PGPLELSAVVGHDQEPDEIARSWGRRAGPAEWRRGDVADASREAVGARVRQRKLGAEAIEQRVSSGGTAGPRQLEDRTGLPHAQTEDPRWLGRDRILVAFGLSELGDAGGKEGGRRRGHSRVRALDCVRAELRLRVVLIYVLAV